MLFALMLIMGLPATAQNDSCDSLKVLFQAEKFEEAYSFMLKENLKCTGNNAMYQVKVLSANGRFRPALAMLRKMQISDEILREITRIEELSLLEIVPTGASILPMDSVNSDANDLACIELNDQLIVLNDSERIISDFPQKRTLKNAFYPGFPEGKIKRQIDAKEYWAVEPGATLGDSIYLLSVLRPAPYKKSSAPADWYVAAHEINSGSAVVEMNLIDPEHSLKHPAVRGSEIYVSSDRPDGFGGFDIWKVKWDGENFRNWKNMGEVVNSSADEYFPTWHGDTLLFASNRTDRGYGGYDIYGFVSDKGRSFNMGVPVNSPYNDFNPTAVKETFKYLSSSRSPRTKLDVYRVEFFDPGLFFPELFGRIQTNGGNLAGESITLTSASGAYTKDVVLDEDGYFRLSHIKGMENYKINLNDLQLSEKAKLLLYNDRGVLIKDIPIKKGEEIQFRLLAPEDYYLEKLENRDESILEVDILGAVETDITNKPPLVIYLEDSKGELIGVSKTDSSGIFSFNSVLPDDRYTIRTEVRDPNALIRIFNAKGEEIQTIDPSGATEFIYVRLSSEDEVITITNEENVKVKISQLEIFNLPAIYYGLNEYELSEDGRLKTQNLIELLKNNPDVSIELSGHTDARGEARYNMRLSQKRIDAVIEHLVSSGINRSRINGTGYGESKLLNRCSDGVECTEVEHAANRRTEIRIFQDPLNKSK